MGMHEKAEMYVLKALDIEIKILEEDHISTALAYKNLGDIYTERKMFSNAKHCYEKTLKVYKVFYGEKNKKTRKMQEKITQLSFVDNVCD